MNPSNGVEFRAANLDDAKVIEAMLRDAGLPKQGAAEHLDGFIVAQRGGQLIGCGGIEFYEGCGLLRSLTVVPTARGAGFAALLVNELEAAARRRGCAMLFLRTTDAARWFVRYGYAQIAPEEIPPALEASSQFRGACPQSAVVLRKRLD